MKLMIKLMLGLVLVMVCGLVLLTALDWAIGAWIAAIGFAGFCVVAFKWTMFATGGR